jgi:AMMECR1 domain-containing protein
MRADDQAVNLVEKLEARTANKSRDDNDSTFPTASEGGYARSRSSTYSTTPADSVVASDMEEDYTDVTNIATQKNITLEATNEMCFYCFDVLLEELLVTQANSSKVHHHKNGNENNGFLSHLFSGSHNNSPPSATRKVAAAEDGRRLELINFVCTLPDSKASCPLFVTWDKSRSETPSSGKYELRGCIGTLAPRILANSLGEYAITSALHDRRFQPIRIREVPQLRVAVSLLIDYEDCGSNVHDWTVGKHGIVLKFSHHDNPYSATYLPEVALEQK